MKNSTKQRKWNDFKLFLYVAPAILLVILFSYVPLWGWSFAFFQYKPGRSLFNSTFVGLDNFKVLFGNVVMRRNLFRVLKNTFGIHLLGYLFTPLPMIFAILLSELRGHKFRKVVQSLTTLPNFISWVILFSLSTSLFGASGLVNTIFKDFGAEGQVVNILTTDKHQGTYLNAGSDTEYWANINEYLKWFGYEPTELKYLLESDMINAEYKSILNDDSKYKEGLKWYNQAYRRGLLDPDSISTDRQTQKAKVDNGHAMVTSGTLQGYAACYKPVYMEGQKIYQESWNSIYGNKYLLVINAKSKNIDAAVAFMDMLADADAYFEVKNGPEGDAVWYLDENGVCQVQQDFLDNYGKSDVKTLLSNGEEMALWSTPWLIDDNNFDTSYIGPDGEHRKVRSENWTEFIEATYNTEEWNQWKEFTGYDYYADQVMDAGNYYLTSDLDYITNFASIPDDMMKLTIDALRDVVVNASWKMVYAESDEEFESLWTQMVKDCEDLGAQDIIDWRLDDLAAAKETRDSLQQE